MGAENGIHPLQRHRRVARLPEHFPAGREPDADG